MKKHTVEVDLVSREGGSNVLMSLMQENAAAIKDAGIIKAGELMFSAAKKNVPANMSFFVDKPLGKLMAAGLLCVGVNMYNNKGAGAVVTAMMASAMNDFTGMIGEKLVDETCARLEKLHADRTDMGDISAQRVAASNEADGSNDKDTRFSATIGETTGADVKTAPPFAVKTEEVKAVADKAIESAYWPAKSADLIEQGGRFKCPLCGKFVKRNKLGTITPPGKTEVLACGDCRAKVAKEVAKAKAEAAAIEQVKKEEAEYHELKNEITKQEELVSKLEKKFSSFEAMLKADPNDEMTKTACESARNVLEKANNVLGDMYEKQSAFEKKAGLSTAKTEATPAVKVVTPSGKPGVLGKLDASTSKK